MIDVSEYQERVDWPKVKEAGHTHAMIKATGWYGSSNGHIYTIDPWFTTHVRDARHAGMTIGLYHYADPAQPPHRDAAFFLRNAFPHVLEHDIVPHLDLEITGGHSMSFVNDWKAQWFAAVDHELGRMAGFYSYWYFWKSLTLYPERPVWGAFLGPSNPVAPSWWARQYSFTGIVPGIAGHVDLSKVLSRVPLV